MYIYICKQCNKNFEHRKKNKKFCSTNCMMENRHQKKLLNNWKIERKCVQCKKTYIPSYKPQKYCSRTCSTIITGKEKTLEKTFSTNCSWCDKQFTKRLSQKGKTGDFCSVKCGQAYKRNYKDQYLKKHCPTCKIEFTCLYRKQTTFCSVSCAKSGKNHHFYGKTGPAKGKPTWIKGLTKKTDERVAKMAEKVSATHKKQFLSGERSNFGENNPNHNKKRKQKERSLKQLDNYSKASIYRMKKYDGFKKFFQKGVYASLKTNNQFSYRSTYEKRLMKCLDLDNNVKTYDYEPFSIIYYFEGAKKRYLIDFKVTYTNNEVELIEVKAEYFRNSELVLIKEKAGKEYAKKESIKYKVMTLKEIKSYEKNLGISNE